MIRVFRGRAREPQAQQTILDALARLRSQDIDEIARKWQSGTLNSRDFDSDLAKQVFPMTKRALYEDQYHKCAYCEHAGRRERDHLEHFRPKTRANRLPGHPSGPGYYWLAWAWNNLLFACLDCNLDKGIKFPLACGCQVLPEAQEPPGGESALLIEPGDDCRDPFEHIRFSRIQEGGQERWKPEPRNGSIHGDWTIKTLGLDRQGLMDRYRAHVELIVTQAIGRIREAIGRAENTGDAARLQTVWQEELEWLCDPRQPFIALSCDVLDHYFPRELRDQWELAEPRPDYTRWQTTYSA